MLEMTGKKRVSTNEKQTNGKKRNRYAIIAVELFGFRSPDFRNFTEAIFSMWQVGVLRCLEVS